MALLMEEELAPPPPDAKPLSGPEEEALRAQVLEWRVEPAARSRELVRKFHISPYGKALEFVQDLGRMAEAEDHHPSITLDPGAVTVRWSTHRIKGLHRNDFIMAARTDDMFDATRRTEAP